MRHEHFNLSQQTALIVGSGRNWHTDLALHLAWAGAHVTIALGDEVLKKTAERSLMNSEYDISCMALELSDRRGIGRFLADIIEVRSGIDIFIYNSDIPPNQSFLEMDELDWQRLVGDGLQQMFYWVQAIGRHMVARKRGRIIQIVSLLSERGLARAAAQCTVEGAVGQLTRCLSLEWARDGVTVNAIGVGWDEETACGKSGNRDKLERYIPLKRFCHSDDIAGMMLYLASPLSGYVTGQIHTVSGGVMAHG